MSFAKLGIPLTADGFVRVADTLGVRAPEVWALVAVESRNFGYLPDRRPKILFERHIFARETKNAHNAGHPDISNKTAGGYLGDEAEYERLTRAAALDAKAALRSASWGLGQVMGFNHAPAGFDSPQAMVDAMVESEDAQLQAMAGFIVSEGLRDFLRMHDWTAFALRYNGADQAKHEYDKRLKSEFERFSVGIMPNLTLRWVQAALLYAGCTPGAVDGVNGKRTRSGIRLYRERQGLKAGDEVDQKLIDALHADVFEGNGTAPTMA
jgi:hypothetical protein